MRADGRPLWVEFHDNAEGSDGFGPVGDFDGDGKLEIGVPVLNGTLVCLNAADDRQEVVDGPMHARGQVGRLLCVRALDDDRDHAPERLDGRRNRHDERERDDERSKRAHRARPLDREGVGHAATPATRLCTTESRSSVSNGLFM